MPGREQADSVQQAVESDAANLLYRHGVGSVLVSLLASSGLVLISTGQAPLQLLCLWWLLMTTVLLLRGIDILYRSRSLSSQTGIQSIRRFGVGLTATALMWAAFPIAFFTKLNQTGRAYTTIVLCGMVGGSATVLAPSKTLSFIFCSLLVFPTSILYLTLPGGNNTFLGILGCVFFLVMFVSSGVTHRASMTALRLSRTNEVLMVAMEEERHRTEAANMELKGTQAALHESNQSLEVRIQARTADLEKEMREKERYAAELAYLASTDSLTGLSNRATLAKRLSEAIQRTEAAGQLLSVLFVDLDNFKDVNDVRGHEAGDRVLQAIAQRLAHEVPAFGELARWGGDEFVVAFPGISNADQAIDLARVLRACLYDPIETEEGMVRIDATIGIALFPEHGRTEEELIRAADIAMYASKKERASKIRVFDPSLGLRLTERHLLERALREAIDTKALSLVFQPIITASSGLCETLEALVRWNRLGQRPVLPEEFVPLAEQTGQISELGRWVLTEACLNAALWPGPHAPAVSVNISALQIESGAMLSDVSAALQDSELAPFRLHLELTESIFAGNRSNVISTLSELRDRGVRISLDDFGTGYSCLADLQRLPVDQIKVDKSFIGSIGTDAEAIIRLIVATAQTFGLDIVAEGVETEAQAEWLRSLNIRYLQGYLFSPLLSPEAAREWLIAQRALPIEVRHHAQRA